MGEMPDKISQQCNGSGQASPGSKNQTIRIALEGLALKYRQVLEKLKVTNRKVTGDSPYCRWRYPE